MEFHFFDPIRKKLIQWVGRAQAEIPLWNSDDVNFTELAKESTLCALNVRENQNGENEKKKSLQPIWQLMFN